MAMMSGSNRLAFAPVLSLQTEENSPQRFSCLPAWASLGIVRPLPRQEPRMNEAKKKQDAPSFETAMERLEEIVSSMEGERMSLEEMVSSYEEGVTLLRVCRQRIDHAKLRVETITADLEGGKASLAPFDTATTPAESDESGQTAKARRTKTDSQSDDIRLF